MKFKHLFFAAALFSIAPLFCACNDDDNEIEVPRDPEEDPSSQPDTTPEATSPTEATGLYVINAGNLRTMLMEHFLLLTLKKEQQATMYFLT